MPFLISTPQEMQARGWDILDVIIVSGDAYVDHHAFGAALIGRILEAEGYRVGIIAQPRWDVDEDFLHLGRPRLFFGVTGGNMDSMVNHYTAQRKLRHDDAYSPNAACGLRPDRATIIYTNILRRLFKGCPIILGGIEASLRRIAHYDYWQDKVRSSVLADSKADMIIYGMGEKPVSEVAAALASGIEVKQITSIRGTVVFASVIPEQDKNAVILPDDLSCRDKQTFLDMTRLYYRHHLDKTLYQQNGGRWIRHNPMHKALDTNELDHVYALPFMNAPHPVYYGSVIPAWEQIKTSITAHRGCFGGCNFCAIACHQGREVASRSQDSIVTEAKRMAADARSSGGKGLTITDVGGPTANMYGTSCKAGFPDSCHRLSCLVPDICPNLHWDHAAQLKLLEAVGKVPGIKHVFVASGIRHDMAVSDSRYISAIATKYTGGRLKLAPEHSVDSVLRLMGKPGIASYEAFSRAFAQSCSEAGIKRQIIPYLIIGHPGCGIPETMLLRNWLKKNNIRVEQVQEFTPTPMTISTCMYYTGMDFETGKPIHIPKPGELRHQKDLVLWHLKFATSRRSIPTRTVK
jgi:uncharacterized radical SAM protein YgiQ